VDITLRQWMAAWDNDDAPGVAELFTVEGRTCRRTARRPAGAPASARASRAGSPEGDGIELKMADFAAGGDLAYQAGRFTYRAGSPADSAATRTGRYVVVLQQEGKRWRIRSLQEYADPGAQPPSAPGCGARAGSAPTS
jgi:ketosteroid isomerase-like protein